MIIIILIGLIELYGFKNMTFRQTNYGLYYFLKIYNEKGTKFQQQVLQVPGLLGKYGIANMKELRILNALSSDRPPDRWKFSTTGPCINSVQQKHQKFL